MLPLPILVSIPGIAAAGIVTVIVNVGDGGAKFPTNGNENGRYPIAKLVRGIRHDHCFSVGMRLPYYDDDVDGDDKVELEHRYS